MILSCPLPRKRSVLWQHIFRICCQNTNLAHANRHDRIIFFFNFWPSTVQGSLMMDPLWSETCWSIFKYFIILIVSTYYILCISWIIKCLIIIDAWCKHEDSKRIFCVFSVYLLSVCIWNYSKTQNALNKKSKIHDSAIQWLTSSTHNKMCEKVSVTYRRGCLLLCVK